MASPKDTGSSAYQIESLTHKISRLSEHLQKFRKDKSADYRLRVSVSARSKHLKYLKRTQLAQYSNIIKKLSIRDKAY